MIIRQINQHCLVVIVKRDFLHDGFGVEWQTQLNCHLLNSKLMQLQLLVQMITSRFGAHVFHLIFIHK